MPVKSNPSLHDVEIAFSQIRTWGDKLAFHEGPKFPTGRSYRVPSKNHFQGIQRLRKGKYLAVSGSSSSGSHLFIVKMGSRPTKGRFRSNRLSSSKPPRNDVVSQVVKLSSTYKHGGGFQVIGDYLAVGVEQGGKSNVLFYDVSNPEKPVQLPGKIRRPTATAGAVAIARQEDGHYLVLVGGYDSNKLDFYTSTTADLRTSRYTHIGHWDEGQLTGGDREFGNYQNINLVRQTNGELYFVGLHRNTNVGNVRLGEDWADLFRLRFTAQHDAVIRKMAKRHMTCKDGGHFDAGAGLFWADSDELFIYAVNHYTHDWMIRFSEFRPDPTRVSPLLKDIRKGWVELYDDVGLRDRSVMIDYIDRKLRDYRDYDRIEGFEDKTSSAKWLLPADWHFLLFEHKNYKGRMLKLHGNGQIRQLSQLKNRNWNDKVSSSRFAKVEIHSLNEAWVELFDDNTFRDRRMTITGTRYASRSNYKKVRVEGKKGFGDKVSSARWQIPAGYSYRLYEHDNYRGKYIDLVGDGTIREISNFKRKKFNDKVSSSKYRKTR